MKKFAVIVAGGSGIRMGTNIPKQFLLLNGKPVLWHTINAFLDAFSDIEIVLVLPQNNMVMGEELKAIFENKSHQIHLAVGGITRFHSVQNGLELVPNNAVVFVHDGVRCLISKDLINKCYEQAVQLGSAIPAVAATDSIRMMVENEHIVANRNNVRIVQTPQTFLASLLKPAFNQPYNDSFTDEATVVESFGNKVFLCNGDYNNIKITRPVDLLVAENILSANLK
jgi:2-C-methyl-D-erythritol 4-phosphate cytidylyltransferase